MFCAQCGQRVSRRVEVLQSMRGAVVASPPPPPAASPALPSLPPLTSGEDWIQRRARCVGGVEFRRAGAGRGRLERRCRQGGDRSLGTGARDLRPCEEHPADTVDGMAGHRDGALVEQRHLRSLCRAARRDWGDRDVPRPDAWSGRPPGPLGMVRVGIFAGLMHAILLFGLSFLQVFLISWLVDALAPSFGGQPNSLAALKVTAYSFTPGWIAAVLNVVPVLGVIGVLAALYGLYLLYLGLPVLMQSPKDKSVGYTVVLVICAVVLSVLVTTLSTCAVAALDFLGLGAMARHGGSSAATAKTDTAGVLANIFGGNRTPRP